MTAKEKKKQYMIEKGLRKPKEELFRKTEGQVRYEYNGRIAFRFAHWSAMRRDEGLSYAFTDFYNQLQPEYLEMVKVIALTGQSVL